jgi:hypothetical protein
MAGGTTGAGVLDLLVRVDLFVLFQVLRSLEDLVAHL